MSALARDYSDRLTDPEYDPDPSEAAPLPGCLCAICQWCRYGAGEGRLPDRLVRPDDPEWKLLLRLAEDVTR
jgi:hypothetical protein